MSIVLGDITQDQYDSAESIVIELLRTEYPSLDLRRGTVIRDLLVRPAAQMVARDNELLEELQQKQTECHM